jgi:hypothetical protein
MSNFGTFICPKTGKEGCRCQERSYPPVFGQGDADLHVYLNALSTTDKIVFGEENNNTNPNFPSVDTPGFFVRKYQQPM